MLDVYAVQDAADEFGLGEVEFFAGVCDPQFFLCGHSDFDYVRLVGAESDFATLHKVYGWMVNGVQFTPQDRLPRMIPLIEFDNWDKNIFRVVNQFTVEYTNNGQKENRRADVLLFVNGIPLCVIELKNPADANAS